MSLPLLKDFALMLTQWKSQLDPVVAAPITQGQALTGVAVGTSATTIKHNLGRQQQGWFVTDTNAAATIYRTGSFNDTYMVLVASASVTVNLWVY